jgi:hypothetical protein
MATIRELGNARVNREVGHKIWVGAVARDSLGCASATNTVFLCCLFVLFGFARAEPRLFTASPVATSYQLTLFSLQLFPLLLLIFYSKKYGSYLFPRCRRDSRYRWSRRISR